MNDREELIAKIEALSGITIDMFTTTAAERIADFITEQIQLAQAELAREFLAADPLEDSACFVDRKRLKALAQLAPKPEKGQL